MESIQLPVSVVITLGVSLVALAFTVTNPEAWISPNIRSQRPDPALTTECERLVIRYLVSDNPVFEDLLSRVSRFTGTQSLNMMLGAVNQAMEYDAPFRKDRVFKLRGRILDRMGQHREAARNFRASLRWDMENIDTRKRLVRCYLKSGSSGLAKAEIEKIIGRSKNKRETKHYKKLLKGLESAS